MTTHSAIVQIAGSTVTPGVIEEVKIVNGREQVSDSTMPATCTIRLLQSSSLGTYNANAINIGDTLTVNLLISGYGTSSRFSGLVTNVTADIWTVQVIAVAYPIAQLGRTTADVPAYTSQLTGTVITNLLALAATKGGLAITSAGQISPGTVTISTPAATNANILSQIQQALANEPSGIIRDDANNGIWFDDYDDRRVTVPAVTFAGSEIGRSWSATKNVTTLVNSATVTYGSSATTTYTDATSATAKGLYSTTFASKIDSPVDAETFAERTVAHGLNPYWQPQGITVDMGGMTAARQDLIRDLQLVGQLVQIPALMSGAQTQFYVEGYTDRIARTTWWIDLNLSDRVLTQAAQRYIDVIDGVTWGTVTPATTRWFDLNSVNI